MSKFSEPNAHHYIEKQAMDMRQTRKEIAQSIINSYENGELIKENNAKTPF